MEEYPGPDEEYELMYQEEMEVMREIEKDMLSYINVNVRKSKNSLKFNSSENFSDSLTDCSEEVDKTIERSAVDDPIVSFVNQNEGKGKKRCLSTESLLDITSDLEIDHPSKKQKNDSSPNSNCHFKNCNEFGITSLRIPKWPFIPLSVDFGERLYVKVTDSTDGDIFESTKNINKNFNLLLTPFSTLKSLAQQAIRNQVESSESEHLVELEDHGGIETTDLWVEKYKPRTYFDLLSDEAVNRTLLNWLKMWDKVVFNKEVKAKAGLNEKNFNVQNQIFKELDSDGRPHHKIALLCGPPGLGKTTLAHVVATLAGYNAIEVNASDDRSVEAFSSKLEAATGMKSVMGSKKPNCLILDEIDGAPAPTIDFLLKYINGKVNEKTKKGKKEKPSKVIKRPVICICNELHTPSLRQLRQQAFVVHFPNTSSSKLAHRLLEICRKQDIKTDLSTLTLLCDKAQNDIRSCISTLHFFKNKNGQRFKSVDVLKTEFGQKDIQKDVFNLWKEIFQISVKKKNLFSNTVNKSKEDEVSYDISYSKKGMDKLQNLIQIFQSSGDYDRLLQGVFENYLKAKMIRSTWTIVLGLEWFSWFDILDTMIKKGQNFVLMPYLPYSFAAWHLLFASSSFLKITYPNVGYENYQKEMRRKQILNDVLRGLNVSIRSHSDKFNILLDILPLFKVILVPSLRPVNPAFFNQKEKSDFKHLIDVMMDYNLNYIQQRSADGTYFYQLDPNINELTHFTITSRSENWNFPYNMKQMIAHEIELLKLRRNEKSENVDSVQSGTENKRECIANQEKSGTFKLTPLTPKEIKPKESEAQYKDFFGRVVKVNETSLAKENEKNAKSTVWFCYKEGYNNAVKKDITMADIL